MPHFGETLKRLREQKRYSQDRLAAEAGVSRSTVQNAEGEAEPSMHGENYRKIAKALGLTTEQLDAMWKVATTAVATTTSPLDALLADVARRHELPVEVIASIIADWLRGHANLIRAIPKPDDLPGIIERHHPEASQSPPPAAASTPRRR